MKAPTWLPSLGLVLPLAAAVVTGCPGSTNGINTSTTLTLSVLAVTATDPDLGRVIPKVYLKWNEVPGAAKYELNTTTSTKPLQSSADTSFVDASGITEGQKISYFVRALDATNGPKTQSDTVAVTILGPSVGKPGELQITPATGDRITSATPTLSWGAAANATGYFVKVTDTDTKSAIYAALTDQTSVQVGQLPFKAVTWPTSRFSQTGENQKLTLGKLYKFEVHALKGDSESLAAVKAVDVSTSDLRIREYSNP